MASAFGGCYSDCEVALAEDGSEVYRVIIADDDPEFRQWLRLLLESSKDFQVVGEAGSGEETINLVASLVPDVIIADVYMPDPDGLAVARHVQQHFSGVRAILVSANEERAYERLAREDGALAFIPKARLSLPVLCRTMQGER